MNKNSRVVAQDRYPKEKFVPDLVDAEYFTQFVSMESHICELYQIWFQREISNNHFFINDVFIEKVPRAVSLFKKIVNDDDFFKYVICQIDEFTPLRNIIDGTGFHFVKHDCYAVKSIIIPESWKVLSSMYNHDYAKLRRGIFNDSAFEFFKKCDQDYIQSVREKFPIEINFSDDFIESLFPLTWVN